MVDMRIIWKAQLDFCKAIADDIVEHNASKKICKYADKFAMIESPYNTSGGYYGNDFIRINYGEAYCYLVVDDDNNLTGDVWWNNDEMHIDNENNSEYDSSISTLETMSIEDAYEYCPYIDCYEEYEGKEKEYAKSLEYIPYK